jgi:hypothetical protein
MGKLSKNSTPFTLAEIENWPLLLTVKNNWRQRLVTVYSHPTDANSVVTVGKPFDGSGPIICIERREEWSSCFARSEKFQVYN